MQESTTCNADILAADLTGMMDAPPVPMNLHRRSTDRCIIVPAVRFGGERFESLMAFDEVIERTGLGGVAPNANHGQPVDAKALAQLQRPQTPVGRGTSRR